MFNWEIDRVDFSLPNRPFGKTHKDNRMSRLIDLDRMAQNVNTVLASIDTQVSTMEDSLANSGYTYTERLVTATELTNMESVYVELLPALTGNNYYVFDTVIAEYTNNAFPGHANPNTTDFYIAGARVSTELLLQAGGTSIATIRNFDTQIITSDVPDTAYINSSNVISSLQAPLMFARVGEVLQASTGTMLVKMWYKIETLGSNL